MEIQILIMTDMFDAISYSQTVGDNLQVRISAGDHRAQLYVRQYLNIKLTDIVKNIPERQAPMRRLDLPCLNRYADSFRACTHASQPEIVQQIAYPP